MRTLRHLSLSLVLLGFSVCAPAQQHQNLTDAERMDFVGPVKSVSVETTTTDVVWNQPGGPALVLPVSCRECEFDPKGNRTKFGQIFDGHFQGETIHLLFDGQGHITGRFAEDAASQIVRREVVGPFGNTEESSYKDEELQSHVLFSYDPYGHQIDWLTLDGAGNQQGRTVVFTDKDGNDTEQWDYGKEGELLTHVRHTVDPKTKVEHFTSFEPSGGAKLMWTLVDKTLTSFWELPGSQPEYGEGFFEDIGDDTFATYQCHADLTCERSRVHYAYLDAKRRNPQSIEWRDDAGELRYAAFYEYEIDTHRNWTHRAIWVWSASLGERKLYETDSRILSYWSQ